MEKLQLNVKEKSIQTDIVIGKDLAEMIIRGILPIANHFALITDENLLQHQRSFISRLKESLPVIVLSIPPGESSKNRQTKEWLEDEMCKQGLGRDSAVIAFGGGVVTDLAGFVASTYSRGIPLIIIPTSLLAMIDASIGGKTGVNTFYGKNLIGSFYYPISIYMDLNFLDTLPKDQMREGMAEVIKHAIISDANLFSDLEKNVDLSTLVSKNVLIKKEVVEKDVKEENLRSILNFGHTIGHSIELASQYQIPHGSAVALGMLAEAYLSYQMQLLSLEDFKRIEQIIKQARFPLSFPKEITKEQLLNGLKWDKKSLKSRPRFVLINKIGEVFVTDGRYCHFVEDELIHKTLEWLLS